MRAIVFLTLLFIPAWCHSADEYESFKAEWADKVTYFDKNNDYTTYRVATYNKASGDLLVYYQGNVLENNPNQLSIKADGAVVWGPKSSEWSADSAIIIKPLKTIHFSDRFAVEPSSGAVTEILTFVNDPVVSSIRLGAPLEKLPQ